MKKLGDTPTNLKIQMPNTNMKPTVAPLYLFLFLHIHTLLVSGDPPPIYTPVEDITLNCGYSGSSRDLYSNRNWTGDINSQFSPIEAVNTTSQVKEAPPSSSASQVPYTTARLSRYKFTYRFYNLTAGQKFIRLYFNPASYPNFEPSKALFSVTIGRYTVLKDFNASATADANFMVTLYEEFCLNIDNEGENINITFTPSTKAKGTYAFINGIEIVSMPTNLYYSPTQSYGVSYPDNEVNYYIENNTALEMVYRINVGGSPVSPNEDTGMYREWDSADDIYLDDLSRRFSVISSNNTIELSFEAVPEYSAPKAVYVTGRSMGGNNTFNKSYNLTWAFPVDSNFSYLVRLHFCEFESVITQPRDRAFLIYIANITTEEVADVILWSGGNGSPVYRDYYVYMTGQNSKKVNLFVTLQANPRDSETGYNDAILNGLEIFKLNNSIGNLAGPNPSPPPKTMQSSPNKPNKKSTHMLAIAVSVVPSILLVLFLSLLGFLVFSGGHWEVKDSGSSYQIENSLLPSDLCHYFSLTEIKAATKNFDDSFIIGVGGFGHVYKGHFDDGATLVAIKRLKATSSQGAHEFMTEIKMLSGLRHHHLVSLIGYCADQGEMVLVYDYMARGTLSDHLHHTKKPHLPWEQRLRICIGAAQGLHYLHTGTKGTIIHRDVKSTNILLDEKWVAKVSDFGLSKMGNITISKTHISTKVKGSFGYLDPDYYRRQQLTEKSDVYSFGVVLCEVLCGRPAVTIVDNNRVGLAGWAKKCYRDGKLDQIVDPNLKGEIAVRCLHRFASIAMSCMDDNGINRPPMDDVVRGLQFALQMQENNEDYIDHIERTVQHEISLIKDNEGSCSSEQSRGAKESIQELTRTIFSEIIDPVGR